MTKKEIKTRNELQYEPLLHGHLWFPGAAGHGGLDLQYQCGAVEHTADTIFIYASKTLDAELD